MGLIDAEVLSAVEEGGLCSEELGGRVTSISGTQISDYQRALPLIEE